MLNLKGVLGGGGLSSADLAGLGKVYLGSGLSLADMVILPSSSVGGYGVDGSR